MELTYKSFETEIKADGAAQAILDEWINTGEEIPFLE